MIFTDTKRRILKSDAIPSMHLFNDIETINSNMDNNSNVIMPYTYASTSNNEAMENIECDPNSIPILKSKDKKKEEKIVELKRNVRKLKKSIHKKKKIIEKQKMEKRNLRPENKWINITKNLTKSQKIFFDIIEKNLKRAPEV